MIVDKRLAIVGGRNLADEYFGLDETVNFRDMELMVGGPAVVRIADIFDNYWNDQWSFPIEEIIQLKPSSSEVLKAQANSASTTLLNSMRR